MSEPAPELYMVLLGCTPNGRNTEQHDVFFCVARDLPSLLPAMRQFWPDTKLHIDAYEIVRTVGGHAISVVESSNPVSSELSLYFVNLGGYAAPDFEEYHHKLLIVARDASEAARIAKASEFYRKGQGQRGGGSLTSGERSHIDDRLEVEQVLAVGEMIGKYALVISPADVGRSGDAASVPSERHIGYLPFSRLEG